MLTRTAVAALLTAYSSLPLHGPRAKDAAAIVRGERFALAEAGGAHGERRTPRCRGPVRDRLHR